VFCVSRFHVCEMEGFNGPKELNSTDSTGVVMLEVEHNTRTYREWYKRKWKEDTCKRVQCCRKRKIIQVQVEKQLQIKIVENVGTTEDGGTKSIDAYVRHVQKVSAKITKGITIYATTKLTRYDEDFQQLVFEK